MDLTAFLNPIKEENKKVVVSKRFVDAEGKPIKWEIRAITAEEDEALRKSCTRKVQVPGKKGQFTQEIDTNEYLGLLAVTCTVFPNLNDAELQNAYGVMGADALLKKMLNAGEYTSFLANIQEMNGFDTSMDELVDEAKN
ncbi:MAG: phage portal protein [Epulopiscium sp.]|jgi:hypothetical protein|nr:phage portal protein [Candidatus Epulonipiscium sp.]